MALVFLRSGYSKVSHSGQMEEQIEQLEKPAARMFIRFVGIAEILGSIGLILPWALNIWPFLTMWAAVGLSIVMVGAIIIHLRAYEWKYVLLTSTFLIVLIIIAVFRVQ